jgi:hypothetical protein
MSCFWCKNPISSVALVDLVYTWEPFIVDDDSHAEELFEVAWHKHCYMTAQQGVQATRLLPSSQALGDNPPSA